MRKLLQSVCRVAKGVQNPPSSDTSECSCAGSRSLIDAMQEHTWSKSRERDPPRTPDLAKRTDLSSDGQIVATEAQPTQHVLRLHLELIHTRGDVR